jgi:serine/threonine-protein kinase
VKILDFGIAKMTDANITRTGMVFGTLAYMSPEQTLGQSVDHRTDLWSLGVVLYEMLTRQRPFARDSDHALFYAIQHETPSGVIALRPDVQEEVDKTVLRLLEKEPARRYDSANTLIKTLQNIGV